MAWSPLFIVKNKQATKPNKQMSILDYRRESIMWRVVFKPILCLPASTQKQPGTKEST
jgi:hypothetical protein